MVRERLKDAFWGIILPLMDTMWQFVTSQAFREFLKEQAKRRAIVRICIDKAARSHKILTGYTAVKTVSISEVDQAIFYSPDKDALLLNLRKCTFGNNDLFVLLLFSAIVNTFVPTTPQWAVEGGNDTNNYSLPMRRK